MGLQVGFDPLAGTVFALWSYPQHFLRGPAWTRHRNQAGGWSDTEFTPPYLFD